MAYKRIPLLQKRYICPLCGQEIRKDKSCLVAIYHFPDKIQWLTISLPFCERCQLPFADASDLHQQIEPQMSEGWQVYTFYINQNSKSHDALCRLMDSYPPTFCPAEQSAPSSSPYRPAGQPVPGALHSRTADKPAPGGSDDSRLTRLASRLPGMTRCPVCKIPLRESYTFIPRKTGNPARVNGGVCPRCKLLYVNEPVHVQQLLSDNLEAREFTLDGRYLTPFPLKSGAQPSSRRAAPGHPAQGLPVRAMAPGAVVQITITGVNKRPIPCIIVGRKDAACPPEHRFHYTTPTARELLTAAFFPARQRRGVMGSQPFTVTDLALPRSAPPFAAQAITPQSIRIRTGGGFYDRLQGSQTRLVDLLLYSPFSDRYEIIPSTYDARARQSCQYYIDISLYRKFVREHGKPDVDVHISGTEASGTMDQLQSESFLKLYGYSVSAAQGLTAFQRQSLLAEVVDLGFMTISQIAHLLSFFISSHPNHQYDSARDKWEDDLDFIQCYRADPDRFLIVGSSAR